MADIGPDDDAGEAPDYDCVAAILIGFGVALFAIDRVINTETLYRIAILVEHAATQRHKVVVLAGITFVDSNAEAAAPVASARIAAALVTAARIAATSARARREAAKAKVGAAAGVAAATAAGRVVATAAGIVAAAAGIVATATGILPGTVI